jgi:hypothetical protein
VAARLDRNPAAARTARAAAETLLAAYARDADRSTVAV